MKEDPFDGVELNYQTISPSDSSLGDSVELLTESETEADSLGLTKPITDLEASYSMPPEAMPSELRIGESFSEGKTGAAAATLAGPSEPLSEPQSVESDHGWEQQFEAVDETVFTPAAPAPRNAPLVKPPRKRSWWKRIWRGQPKNGKAARPQASLEADELHPAEAVPTLVPPSPIATAPEFQPDDRGKAALSQIQDMVGSIFMTGAELYYEEVKALQTQSQEILQDRARPLQDRMAEMDFIHERTLKSRQGIIQTEVSLARHITGATHEEIDAVDIKPAGGPALATIQPQYTDARLLTLVEQRVEAKLAAQPNPRAGVGLRLTLLALVILSAGALWAAVLLPRPAGESGDVYVDLAALYQLQGRADQAEAALNQAVSLGLNSAPALARAGNIYLQLKRYEAAIALFKGAVDLSGSRVEYRQLLAKAYGAAGELEPASALYQALINDDPGQSALYYTQLGRLFYDTKNYTEAIAQYHKALEMGASKVEVSLVLGEIYWEQQKYDLAIPVFKDVIGLDPQNYQAYLRLGGSYMYLEDFPQAIDTLHIAIQLQPDTNWAYHALGQTYVAMKEYDKAIEQFQLALKLHPFANSYVGLGQAYAGQGFCTEATIQFNEALKLEVYNQAAKDGLEQCQQ